MSTTHNHSGIKAGPPGQSMSPDANATIEAIINIVREAKGRLRPARVGSGTGAAYLNVNRDAINQETRLWGQSANMEGPSDKTLAVVMFSDMSGNPIAAYVNYAMHPVSAYLSGITSGDFPGAACRYVEKAFSDKMVMVYTQGASGDQNPLWLRPGTNAMVSRSGAEITGFELVRDNIETPLREGKVPYGKLDQEVADNLEHWMDVMGTILGEETIRIMTSITQHDSNVRIWGIQDILTYPGRVRTNTSTGREGAQGIYEDGPQVDLRVGLLGIGNVAITTINAEVYNIIAQNLKKASPMTNTIMVTSANGRAKSGYIINDEAYGRNTFQALGARIKPGYAEQGIVNKLVSLIDQYDHKK